MVFSIRHIIHLAWLVTFDWKLTIKALHPSSILLELMASENVTCFHNTLRHHICVGIHACVPAYVGAYFHLMCRLWFFLRMGTSSNTDNEFEEKVRLWNLCSHFNESRHLKKLTHWAQTWTKRKKIWLRSQMIIRITTMREICVCSFSLHFFKIQCFR